MANDLGIKGVKLKETTNCSESDLSGVVMCADVELLYALKDAVNIIVAENFGYSPNTDNYNRIEKEWRDQEFIVKSMYPEEYKTYEDKEYT